MESYPPADIEVGAAATTEAPATGFFACFSVAYYQPHFNVDTTDVRDRLLATLMFYKAEPTFLNLIGDAPDLYGPFWLASTLIFTVSVTSNLAKSLQDGLTYDFELVTSCVSLVYGYLVGLPALLWAAGRYLLNIPSLGFTQLTCLVGYSLFLYLPATFVATSTALAWPALVAASGCSTLFLLRSLKPVLEVRREKGASVMGVLVLTQVIFMIVLKLKFYSHHGHIRGSEEAIAAAEMAAAASSAEAATSPPAE